MNSRISLCALALCTLAACASAPNVPSELVAARTAVETMKSEPMVLRYKEEADRASSELAKAEQLFTDRKELNKVKHRAYLAQQYAALVETQAANARVQEQISTADERRQALVLSAREQEASRARARAEASEQRAELAMREAKQQAARADKAAELAGELSTELDELKAEQTERGLVLTLTDVLFDTNESALKPGANQAMDKLAAYLKKSTSSSILVEGHTDDRGAEDYNAQLSERRAGSVRQALVERGVPGDRVRAIGKGESFPVAVNSTRAGRQQNRRVEIIVASQ